MGQQLVGALSTEKDRMRMCVCDGERKRERERAHRMSQVIKDSLLCSKDEA